MSTKNNPGPFDCYTTADPDEPMFVLLGRDPFAPMLVGWWVGLKTTLDPNADEAKMKEALETAHAMDEWLLKLGKEEKIKLRELVMQEGMRIAQAIERDAAREESK